jgi:formylmethanofuran dehydrogenase subunit E
MSVAAERGSVSDDATLDAFAPEETESEPEDESDSPDATDATPVTSSWSDASVCEACGEAAGRRWLDDGERVCAACKRWS